MNMTFDVKSEAKRRCLSEREEHCQGMIIGAGLFGATTFLLRPYHHTFTGFLRNVLAADIVKQLLRLIRNK